MLRIVETAADGALLKSFVAGGKVRLRMYHPYQGQPAEPESDQRQEPMRENDRFDMHDESADETTAFAAEATTGNFSAVDEAAIGFDDPCYDDEEGTIEGDCPTQEEIDDFLATLADQVAEEAVAVLVIALVECAVGYPLPAGGLQPAFSEF